MNCFITEGVCKGIAFPTSLLGYPWAQEESEHLDCETEHLPNPKLETPQQQQQTITSAEFKMGSCKITGMDWRQLVGISGGQEKGEEGVITKSPPILASSVADPRCQSGGRTRGSEGRNSLEMVGWSSLIRMSARKAGGRNIGEFGYHD